MRFFRRPNISLPSIPQLSGRQRVLIAGLLVVAVATLGALYFTVFTGGGGDGDDRATGEQEATPEVTEELDGPGYFGVVQDTQGKPIPEAAVLISGPFGDDADAEIARVRSFTNERGEFSIPLPEDGDYDIFVRADGFTDNLLVGRDDQVVGEAPPVDGPTEVVIELKTMAEFGQGPSDPSGTDGFIYGAGIEKHEVCRVIMTHALINSCDEINDPVVVTKSGQGWTTYVRGGQSISTMSIDYQNAQFWEVTFKNDRPDGLKVLFVKRTCGNISVPPGEKMLQPPEEVFKPPPPPGKPPKTPTQPPPGRTPPPTLPPGVTPPPTATPPTPPPPPPPTQPPVTVLGCPLFALHPDPGSPPFNRVGTATASRNVQWSVSGHLATLAQDTRHITVLANEGATVTFTATDEFGQTVSAACSVPVSVPGATPVPTNPPAPTLPPPPVPTEPPITTPVPPP